MKISFITNHIYINGGWSPWDTRIGGSEECVVEWARRLSVEHDVQVFHNGRHGIYEGVVYKPHMDYRSGDITININYPEFEPQGKTIYWSSLTNNPNLDKFDAVCVLSQYARDNTHTEHRNIHILPPGYDETKIYPDKKIPKQCLYASSPDRGLDILLEAWPEIYDVHPDATLLVTYGAEATPMPGVTFLGEVDEETMNELYQTSDIWAYPCTRGELYCMTGIKAQVAECWPVIIPTMALAETVKYGTFSTMEDYAQDLTDALSKHPKPPKYDYPTWQYSTDKLLKIIESVVK